MKNHKGFGFVELLIAVVLVFLLTSFFLKNREKENASLRKTLATGGVYLSPNAVDASGASGVAQNPMHDAGKAVEDRVKAIEAERMKQLECQTDSGKKCSQ